MGDNDARSEATSGSDVIQARSFVSCGLTDFRRTSFVETAVEMAKRKYDVSSKSIFQGEWVTKLMGNELYFKKRFVWIDPTDKSFHWSKSDVRSVAHKRIRLDGRVVSVTQDSSSFSSTDAFGITVMFLNGEKLQMKLEHDGIRNHDEESLHLAQIHVEDWVKVFSAMIAVPFDADDVNK